MDQNYDKAKSCGKIFIGEKLWGKNLTNCEYSKPYGRLRETAVALNIWYWKLKRKDNKVEIKRTFCFLFSSELPASSPLVRLPFLFLDPEQKYVKYQATIFPKTIALPDKNCPFIQSLLYEVNINRSLDQTWNIFRVIRRRELILESIQKVGISKEKAGKES